MINVNNKLNHYFLNLDYKSKFYNFENQTNMLINKVINTFINKYENDFTNKIFIYDMNDDLAGMIGYQILSAIENLKADFNFSFYNKKPKKLKKMVNKKKKSYSYNKVNKNRDNYVLISSFNPIYEVTRKNKKSNKKLSANFNIVEQFTVEELEMAQIFYHVSYIKESKEDREKINSLKEEYNDITKIKNTVYSLVENQSKTQLKCIAVWIGDNLNKDVEILNKYEQEDVLLLYFYNNPDALKILEDPLYHYLLKRTSNRPQENHYNINNYNFAKYFYQSKQYIFLFEGDWPEEEKSNITGGD